MLQNSIHPVKPSDGYIPEPSTVVHSGGGDGHDVFLTQMSDPTCAFKGFCSPMPWVDTRGLTQHGFKGIHPDTFEPTLSHSPFVRNAHIWSLGFRETCDRLERQAALFSGSETEKEKKALKKLIVDTSEFKSGLPNMFMFRGEADKVESWCDRLVKECLKQGMASPNDQRQFVNTVAVAQVSSEILKQFQNYLFEDLLELVQLLGDRYGAPTDCSSSLQQVTHLKVTSTDLESYSAMRVKCGKIRDAVEAANGDGVVRITSQQLWEQLIRSFPQLLWDYYVFCSMRSHNHTWFQSHVDALILWLLNITYDRERIRLSTRLSRGDTTPHNTNIVSKKEKKGKTDSTKKKSEQQSKNDQQKAQTDGAQQVNSADNRGRPSQPYTQPPSGSNTQQGRGGRGGGRGGGGGRGRGRSQPPPTGGFGMNPYERRRNDQHNNQHNNTYYNNRSHSNPPTGPRPQHQNNNGNAYRGPPGSPNTYTSQSNRPMGSGPRQHNTTERGPKFVNNTPQHHTYTGAQPRGSNSSFSQNYNSRNAQTRSQASSVAVDAKAFITAHGGWQCACGFLSWGPAMPSSCRRGCTANKWMRLPKGWTG